MQSLSVHPLDVRVDGVSINQTMRSKSLALHIHVDENISWKEPIHTINLKKEVASSVGALKRIRPFISMHTAILKFYRTASHFDYCSAVWDAVLLQLIEKLQKLQIALLES